MRKCIRGKDDSWAFTSEQTQKRCGANGRNVSELYFNST